MRTCIYIDGYNLYYSTLTKSPWKWLDIKRLFFDQVVLPVEPASRLVGLKYFTAPVLARYAGSPQSPERQTRYHNALKSWYGEELEIVMGYHSLKETYGIPVDVPSVAVERRQRFRHMEEKQTDVNIGLHMYRDAVRGTVEQLVLISNDSDLEPVLASIRNEFSGVRLGLVFPAIKSEVIGRRKSGRLQRHAHWTREHLRREELMASQLPDRIQNRKNKTIRKPEGW